MSYTLEIDLSKSPIFVDNDLYIEEFFKQKNVQEKISKRTFEASLDLNNYKLIGRSYRDYTKGGSGSVRILMESQKVFSISSKSWFKGVHLSPFQHRKTERVYFRYFTDRLGTNRAETITVNGPQKKPEGYPEDTPISDVLVKPGTETPFFTTKEFHTAYYEFDHQPDIITITSKYQHKETGLVVNITYKFLIASTLLKEKNVNELKKMTENNLAFGSVGTLNRQNLLAPQRDGQKTLFSTKQQKPMEYFSG